MIPYKDITFGPTKRPDIQYNDVIKIKNIKT